MSLPLPTPVAAYLAAANAFESLSAASQFAPDAIVLDEGQRYTGSAAVAAWIAETGRKYQPRVEVVGLSAMDGKVLASVSVSGAFVGSPIALRYAFTIEGERIARLEVRNWRDRSGFAHE